MSPERVGAPPFLPDYRASGLLLHVTSLPSRHGIGDLEVFMPSPPCLVVYTSCDDGEPESTVMYIWQHEKTGVLHHELVYQQAVPFQTAIAWAQEHAPTRDVERIHVKHARAKDQVVPSTAVQTPNPPFQKKPWYNPAGWFSKEEYASFNGEPVRQDLTEPPAGYRVPSASQPYGLGPDKKGAKPTASDMMMTPVTGQSPGH